MSKSEKLLLLFAVLLTIVAAGFWYVNLTNEEEALPDTGSPTANTDRIPGEDLGFDGLPSFTEENLEVLSNFGLTFASTGTDTVSVELSGDTLNVRSVEAIIKYDPNVVTITSVNQGELFDLYINTDLSEGVLETEDGMAYVSLVAAFAGEDLPSVVTSGVLGTITFERVTNDPVSFTLVEFGEGVNPYSKVVTEDGQTYTLAEESVSL